MSHPALRHIRNTLIAALGLAGCTERSGSVPEGEPPDAALLDPDPIHCAGGEPIRTTDGRETGYIRCPDGSTDRVGPATCEPIVDWPSCEHGDREHDACAVDADCTARPGGRCLEGPVTYCRCHYPCSTDTDCPAGEVCVCAATARGLTVGSRCLTAGCVDTEGCGGARCGLAGYSQGCMHQQTLACRTPRDTCWSSRDCQPDHPYNITQDCWPPDHPGAARAQDDPSLRATWHCDAPHFTCGRPLRVGLRPRLARADRRGDWQAGPLRVAADAAMAAHWSAIAALEHASVGSFARFSLQLLALGAPADLLADCQRAAADEIEHARMAYAIASAFAGEAIGPGPLSLEGITLDTDPATVLREVIIEGCIGETLGAVEAAEAARAVEDPAIAAACARIAEDELRHAGLGWRAARWLFERHPALAAMASDVFADGMRHHTDGIATSSDAITRHGIAVRPALRRAAWREVIAPLAARLL